MITITTVARVVGNKKLLTAVKITHARLSYRRRAFFFCSNVRHIQNLKVLRAQMGRTLFRVAAVADDDNTRGQDLCHTTEVAPGGDHGKGAPRA